MRYKLVTRDVGTNKMSSIDNVLDSYTITWNNDSKTGGEMPINPTTTDIPGGTGEPYSFTILNSSIAYLSNTTGGNVSGGINYATDAQNISQTVFGQGGCTVKAKEILASQTGAETTIIITGLNYGATRATTIRVNYIPLSPA